VWKFELENLVDLQPQIDRLYEKKAKLDSARPLPGSVLRKIKADLSLEWTYNSNSIEGNTITLHETQLILQEGITIRGKSLREHFEVYNHEKAIAYLYTLVDHKYTLRGIDILNLHGFVLRSIEDDFAGRLRNGGVRIVGANFTPPNANKVSDFFDELVAFINDNPLGIIYNFSS
jgi:Fic family protein